MTCRIMRTVIQQADNVPAALQIGDRPFSRQWRLPAYGFGSTVRDLACMAVLRAASWYASMNACLVAGGNRQGENR